MSYIYIYILKGYTEIILYQNYKFDACIQYIEYILKVNSMECEELFFYSEEYNHIVYILYISLRRVLSIATIDQLEKKEITHY